jgi:hypothetical protein
MKLSNKFAALTLALATASGAVMAAEEPLTASEKTTVAKYNKYLACYNEKVAPLSKALDSDTVKQDQLKKQAYLAIAKDDADQAADPDMASAMAKRGIKPMQIVDQALYAKFIEDQATTQPSSQEEAAVVIGVRKRVDEKIKEMLVKGFDEKFDPVCAPAAGINLADLQNAAYDFSRIKATKPRGFAKADGAKGPQ